ncbi:hypothetical protein [endosymbiont 'TC1' of Trimyema compressum]|uniref:hypothetical protein n=1 Tax=endosymbiont 'TC1' of Trimyema compressum TaxID=243899 RepID=UPI00139247CF|nr:hypothetical protein [endosymbiont 'TC1' of Trimyema compressum]
MIEESERYRALCDDYICNSKPCVASIRQYLAKRDVQYFHELADERIAKYETIKVKVKEE